VGFGCFVSRFGFACFVLVAVSFFAPFLVWCVGFRSWWWLVLGFSVACFVFVLASVLFLFGFLWAAVAALFFVLVASL
jgi:hypothetical protein